MSSNLTEHYSEKVYRFLNSAADYSLLKNYNDNIYNKVGPSELRMALVPKQTTRFNKIVSDIPFNAKEEEKSNNVESYYALTPLKTINNNFSYGNYKGIYKNVEDYEKYKNLNKSLYK